MKVLIFSVSAGGGHTHAAEAIEKYVLLNNPASEVKIIDTIKYINPILDKVVIGSYLKSLKFNPALFGKLYNFAENYDSLSNVSNKIIEMVIHRLIPLIQSFNPSIIIATHPFSAEMLSILKIKQKIQQPVVTLLTDYASHSFWLHDGIDAYIVSNSDMLDEMVKRGINKDIVFDIGIPVKPDFVDSFTREDVFKKINLDTKKITLLLMGGSLGMGKMSYVYEELRKIKQEIQIIVITGKNQRLHDRLIELQKTFGKETRIIGYTYDVNKYMQSCDLLITKPGGLTVTEALISKIPMALFSAIPGHEQKNAEFLIKHGLAVTIDDDKHCHEVIEELISDNLRLNKMKKNCANYAKPNSGNDIYHLLCHLENVNSKISNN